MPDASGLAAFDPFEIMDEECARLGDFYTSLQPDGWTKDTRCEGWDVRALLAHLCTTEEYNRAALDEKLADLFERSEAAGATDMNSFNDWGVRSRADRTKEDVLAEWLGQNEYFRTEMRKRGRDGTLLTRVGPYPVDLQSFHLASEYATHADDMDVVVPENKRAARLAWREAFSLFALEEAEKEVEVEVKDGNYHVEAGGKQATLSAFDFVEAVTARNKKIPPELEQALRALA